MSTHISLDRDVFLQRLQAVAEETRLALLQLLGEGERCVCELQVELGAAQSRLSFHLRKLKEAGLVEDRRDGRWVYYRLAPEGLEEIRTALASLASGDGGRWTDGSGGCCG